MIVEVLWEWFFEGVCFGVGCLALKAVGRSPSENGDVECLIGLAIILGMIATVVLWEYFG